MTGNGRSREPPPLGRRGGGWVAAQFALFAALLLSALVGLGWPDDIAPAAYAVGALLIALGLALLAGGAIGLGSALTPFPAPRPGKPLSTTGLYARVRHPIYGGVILLALGWAAVFASPLALVLTILLVVLFELKARREELWLVERHPGYAEYRRRTRRKFIPFVY